MPITVDDVVWFVGLLDARDIDVGVEGGWGVDALPGGQRRSHKDLDIIVDIADLGTLRSALADYGFTIVEGAPPSGFVARDERGRAVDVRPVVFDKRGNAVYRTSSGEEWVCSAEGLTGTGTIEGRKVKCLTPEAQVACHTGYTPAEKDYEEVAALHERFGVAVSN